MSQINDSNHYESEGGSTAGNLAKKTGKEITKKVARKAAKVAATKAAAATGSAIGFPAIIGIVVGAFVLFGAILMVLVILLSVGDGEATIPHKGSSGGGISEYGKNEIPSQYLSIYKAAEEKYGVPWNLLAAHHRVETVFSTISPMLSPVGAEGHTQFMPCTWVGWKHPSCGGVGKGRIPSTEKTNPSVIARYGGYGVDANGDGKADPWDIEDAIFSSANYLAANGAAEGRLRDAVFAYNHADWYVEEVLGYADQYINSFIAVEHGGSITGVKFVDISNKWIGNSVYVFGGGRNPSDIARGRFDCSSFVHWAFAQIGINLGPLSSTSTETLKHKGKTISPSKMKPGDLVFFDTYKKDGHVGIYIGNHRFIGAQTSRGVAIEDMSKGYWKEKFNGRVRRI